MSVISRCFYCLTHYTQRYKREDILNDSILIKAYYGLMRLISINRNIPKTGNVQKPEADSSQV